MSNDRIMSVNKYWILLVCSPTQYAGIMGIYTSNKFWVKRPGPEVSLFSAKRVAEEFRYSNDDVRVHVRKIKLRQ